MYQMFFPVSDGACGRYPSCHWKILYYIFHTDGIHQNILALHSMARCILVMIRTEHWKHGKNFIVDGSINIGGKIFTILLVGRILSWGKFLSWWVGKKKLDKYNKLYTHFQFCDTCSTAEFVLVMKTSLINKTLAIKTQSTVYVINPSHACNFYSPDWMRSGFYDMAITF